MIQKYVESNVECPPPSTTPLPVILGSYHSRTFSMHLHTYLQRCSYVFLNPIFLALSFYYLSFFSQILEIMFTLLMVVSQNCIFSSTSHSKCVCGCVGGWVNTHSQEERKIQTKGPPLIQTLQKLSEIAKPDALALPSSHRQALGQRCETQVR